ncbi:MAG TPA: ABC transporter permease [Acidimicrobiia bacterium]|nr:ABC transporter permease [Acidimicrobiia bacterium]
MTTRRLQRSLSRNQAVVLKTLSLPLFLALWEIFAIVRDFRPSVLPRPTAVAAFVVREFGLLMDHTLVTGGEAAVGLILAILVGVGLAAAMAFSTTLRDLVMPAMVSFASVPKLAFAPLLIMWLGIGYNSKMISAFLICVFPILVNATGGMRNVDPGLLDLVRVMKGRRRDEFLKIRLPSALPSLFDGLRIAVPLSVIGAIVTEFIASSEGLGYLIISSHVHFNATLAFASIFMIVSLTMLMYAIVLVAERRLLRWRPSDRAAA